VTQGISIGEFDAALRTVGEGANRAGPIVTWRSAGSSSVGMANSLKAGDIFTGEGFLSTSASPMFAVSWKARELRVLFRIVGRSGAPIERMSRMPGEWEVLYPNSAQFRVASATKDVTVVAGRQEYHGVTVVDLVEIEE
jgi:hypothetical protein